MIQIITVGISSILFMLGVIAGLLAGQKDYGFIITAAAILCSLAAMVTGGFLFLVAISGVA